MNNSRSIKQEFDVLPQNNLFRLNYQTPYGSKFQTNLFNQSNLNLINHLSFILKIEFKGLDRLIPKLDLNEVTNSLKLKLNWSLRSSPNELKLNGYRLFYQHNGLSDTIESNGLLNLTIK